MIKRTLYPAIKEHLEKKEITFIVGPRQAGKTTIMKTLQAELEQKKQPTLFFNLDIEQDAQFFDAQNRLIQKIQLEVGTKTGYIFIDEIQRKKNAGIFLKGIYDMNLPYKFIISGSGSVELKEQLHESLAGRKRLFELLPLNFEEYIHYKTGYRYEHSLKKWMAIEPQRVQLLFEEYINYGGYPQVVLAQTQEEKLAFIDEIYRSSVEKDLLFLLQIQREAVVQQLMQILASQIGNLVTVSELVNTLGASTQTIQRYLWLLEKMYIIRKITPFYTNKRKEITKRPLYYFWDLGLRNYINNSFGTVTQSRDVGFVFENFIFLLLQKQLEERMARICFWRTKDRAEVDFVIQKNNELLPIEVKYQSFRKPTVSRSFHQFLSQYTPAHGIIITKDFTETITIQQTTVAFMPYYELLEKSIWSYFET